MRYCVNSIVSKFSFRIRPWHGGAISKGLNAVIVLIITLRQRLTILATTLTLKISEATTKCLSYGPCHRSSRNARKLVKSWTFWRRFQFCSSVHDLYLLAIAETFQNTNLDRAQLSLCVSLIENGVNPEALAVSTSGSWFDPSC